MKRLKIFPRTFIYTSGIMSIIVIIVHALIHSMLPSFYLNQKREEAKMKSAHLINILEKTNEEEAVDIVREYSIVNNVNIDLVIDGISHKYQGFTPVDIYFDPLSSQGAAAEDEANMQVNVPGGYSVIIEKSTLTNKHNKEYELYLSLSTQPIREAKQVTFKVLPYSILISLLISLMAAYIYSRAMTKPIKNILQVTKDMEALKKDSYCLVDSEDEIGMIAENINSLYDTLWNTIESLEQKIEDISQVEKEKVEFLRSASHELKTPLTSLHILLENMKYNVGKYSDRDLYLEKAQEMVMELNKMVQNILNTSKLQTVVWGQEEDLDIKDLLLETMESYKVLARSKKIQVNIDLEEGFPYYGNKESLKKLFSNIISNAINYTNQGKRINISLLDGTLVVENQCKPLSEDVLKQIFKVFYRPDFSRGKKDGGSGLGLYIVKDILDHEGLEHSFEPSDLGMKFIIDFKN